jgi:hypothetical protein
LYGKYELGKKWVKRKGKSTKTQQFVYRSSFLMKPMSLLRSPDWPSLSRLFAH